MCCTYISCFLFSIKFSASRVLIFLRAWSKVFCSSYLYPEIWWCSLLRFSPLETLIRDNSVRIFNLNSSNYIRNHEKRRKYGDCLHWSGMCPFICQGDQIYNFQATLPHGSSPLLMNSLSPDSWDRHWKCLRSLSGLISELWSNLSASEIFLIRFQECLSTHIWNYQVAPFLCLIH